MTLQLNAAVSLDHRARLVHAAVSLDHWVSLYQCGPSRRFISGSVPSVRQFFKLFTAYQDTVLNIEGTFLLIEVKRAFRHEITLRPDERVVVEQAEREFLEFHVVDHDAGLHKVPVFLGHMHRRSEGRIKQEQ